MAFSSGDRRGDLLIEIDGYVATVTIDRPDKLNALTARFWTDLSDIFAALAAAGTIRAVILTGVGRRAFSAGGDIAGFLALETPEEIRLYQQQAMAAFRDIETSPLPVVAAINGLAFGGGCELTLACDVVVASEDAMFAMPEAALGLVPGFGALRAPEIIGRQMTKYLIATGDRIDVSRAREIGLVQTVVPADRLMDEARAICTRIAGRSPHAVSVGKRMVNRTIDDRATEHSIIAISELHASADRAEGVAAFLEDRTPEFDQRPDQL